MGIETATFIHQLDSSLPLGADQKSQGDDHLRLLKSTLQASFPGVQGAVTSSHTELNILDGATLTTAQLNVLAGINATLTAAELNILDGVTATTAQINVLATIPATLTGAELGILDGCTATAADLNKTKLLSNAVYTPGLVNAANANGLGDVKHFYERNGNVVNVAGRFAITPFANGVSTIIDVDLPIASDLAVGGDVIGVAFMQCGSAIAVVGEVSAETAGNRLRIAFTSNTASPSSGFVSYLAKYLVF